jgi:L-threonylcarbamoyladenylate synthase
MPRTLLLAQDVPNLDVLNEAAEIVRIGQLVVFPVNSGYVIGCDPFNSNATRHVNEVRGHVIDNIQTIVFSDLTAARDVIEDKEIPSALVDALYSGDLTIVFNRIESFRPAITEFDELVSINFPAHPLIRELLHLSGPCAVSAAAPVGIGLPASIEDPQNYFGEQVDLYLDAGRIDGSSSTVINWTQRLPVLVRQGEFPIEELMKIFPYLEDNETT